MKPLRDRVLVKIDDSLSRIIHLAPKTEKWTEARNQLGNRGRVVAVGGGNRHPKTANLLPMVCKVGAYIRFSELEYPALMINGEKHVIISDYDVVGIEE